MTSSRSAPAKLALREITAEDRDDVVALLTRGYGAERTRAFWARAFAILANRRVPEGFPRFGFVLESDRRIVGVLLLIFAKIARDGDERIRCNGSSLYVEPDYRLYTPLLTSVTNKYKQVTVLNLTAADHTHKMVAAQGFVPYSCGLLHAIPLVGRAPALTTRIVDARADPGVPVDAYERDLLIEHLAYGCDSLWCVEGGQAIPFIFRRKTLKGLLPSVQLIYARSHADFVRHARALGWHYAKRMRFVVTLDASERPLGLVGRFDPKRCARFFRGPTKPHQGDLAHTELALFDL